MYVYACMQRVSDMNLSIDTYYTTLPFIIYLHRVRHIFQLFPPIFVRKHPLASWNIPFYEMDNYLSMTQEGWGKCLGM